MTIKNLLLATVLATGSLATVAMAQTAKDDIKDAGSDVKEPQATLPRRPPAPPRKPPKRARTK